MDIARRFVLDLGADKFGPPTERTVALLQSLSDLAALERLHRRILTANTWAELLTSEQLS